MEFSNVFEMQRTFFSLRTPFSVVSFAVFVLSLCENCEINYAGPILEIGGMGAFFWAHLLKKKGILLACIPKTDAIFNHF